MNDKVNEALVEYGSGNVFADLGLPNPEERLAKAGIASAIIDVIRSRGLSQAEAAQVMGLDQPKVSKITRGHLSDFSTERLLQCLLHLGSNVEIVIHKPPAGTSQEGKLSVAYL